MVLVVSIVEVSFSSVPVMLLSVVVMLAVGFEVVSITVSSPVVETAVVSLTTVLVDGVVEVSFSFAPSSLQ